MNHWKYFDSSFRKKQFFNELNTKLNFNGWLSNNDTLIGYYPKYTNLYRYKFINNELLSITYKKCYNILHYLFGGEFSVDEFIETIIDYAIRNKNISVIKYFARNNLSNYVKNKLTDSSEFGAVSLVRYYIGCHVNIHEKHENALLRAAEFGHLNVVKCLVKNSADIHIYEDLPLRLAAKNGHLEIVKYLVKLGCDINIRNNEIYRYSIHSTHHHIVKYSSKRIK